VYVVSYGVVAEEVVVDAGAGVRRENPAFAKSLAHLRNENSRLEEEVAALRREISVKVGTTRMIII
jgi:hypothetical protein